MEKRGPVEFNHAISYVNKIKVSSSILASSAIHFVHFVFDLPIVRVKWGQTMVALFQTDPHLSI